MQSVLILAFNLDGRIRINTSHSLVDGGKGSLTVSPFFEVDNDDDEPRRVISTGRRFRHAGFGFAALRAFRGQRTIRVDHRRGRGRGNRCGLG